MLLEDLQPKECLIFDKRSKSSLTAHIAGVEANQGACPYQG